jgi:PIN domain nuclease of toxin-antitoxin system
VSLLLDTHVVLWWLAGTRLAPTAAERIGDGGELVVVSAASIWEAAIKAALGKLHMPEGLADAVVDEGFEPLPIAFPHAQLAGELPAHHRDPFDRMLVAQALTEGLTIVTHDPVFATYGVPVLAPRTERRRRS